MVAYSFAPQFIEPVSTLKKLQTVRGNRKRHARPEEPVQLYTAMRTKYCRKILSPDPICVDVRPITIELSKTDLQPLQSIEVCGVPLSNDEIDAFAVADGFGTDSTVNLARARMGQFWIKAHLEKTPCQFMEFEGVVIRWRPSTDG